MNHLLLLQPLYPEQPSKIKTETDDGFKTFNEIPVTPAAPPAPIKMSPEETLREKLKLLRALEAMEKERNSTN